MQATQPYKVLPGEMANPDFGKPMRQFISELNLTQLTQTKQLLFVMINPVELKIADRRYN